MTSWKEISENQTRHQSSSNLLSITDSAGYLLFKQSNLNKNSKIREHMDLMGEDGVFYSFGGSELKMNAIAIIIRDKEHP